MVAAGWGPGKNGSLSACAQQSIRTVRHAQQKGQQQHRQLPESIEGTASLLYDIAGIERETQSVNGTTRTTAARNCDMEKDPLSPLDQEPTISQVASQVGLKQSARKCNGYSLRADTVANGQVSRENRARWRALRWVGLVVHPSLARQPFIRFTHARGVSWSEKELVNEIIRTN